MSDSKIIWLILDDLKLDLQGLQGAADSTMFNLSMLHWAQV